MFTIITKSEIKYFVKYSYATVLFKSFNTRIVRTIHSNHFHIF